MVFHIQAQTVSGKWYGLGIVKNMDGSNNYMSELNLEQKGKVVTGTMNYYFRDSLFSNKIEGTFNAATRKLTLKKQPIIFFKSSNTKIGIDCPSFAEFTLRVSKVNSVLSGIMYTTDDYKYTCPEINFSFKKNEDSLVQSLERFKEQNTEEAPVVAKINKPINIVEATFKNRLQQIFQEIEVENDILKIELYDNGAIDYDSVSLFFNQKEIVPKSMLHFNAITIDVTVDTTVAYNELSMFAHNEGEVAPNTAVLILYDGKKRHEIVLSSDMKKNATIRIISKKKNQ
ncbi:MAG: hypothetical protein ACOVNY_03110 [Chitinophagaceae bacterium]